MFALARLRIFHKKLQRLLPDPAVAVKFHDSGVEIVAVPSGAEESLDRRIVTRRKKLSLRGEGVFEFSQIAYDLRVPVEINNLVIVGGQDLAKDQLGHRAD